MINVTIRQLRAFVTVAKHNHFSLAAEQLHITPSALSMLVKDLEEELGVKLLDRHTRMVRVTDVGREFLASARRTLEDLDLAVINTREQANYQRGRVTVVSASVLNVSLLVPFIREFQENYPGVHVILRETAEENIRNTLIEEQADIGVGTFPDHQSEIIETELFVDGFDLLVSSDHTLARKTQVAWSALSDWPFIALSPDNPLRQEIDRHLSAQSIALNIAYEVSFPWTVFALVSNNMGISLLPTNSRKMLNAPGITFLALGKPVLKRRVCTLQIKHRSLSPAVELFHRLLIEYASKHRALFEVNLQAKR